MDGWPQSVVSAIWEWHFELRIRRWSGKISRDIYPALWESVRRKLGSVSEQELREYAKARASQLAQERVDEHVRSHPDLPGSFATRLLLKSSERAATSVRAAIAEARRPAA